MASSLNNYRFVHLPELYLHYYLVPICFPMLFEGKTQQQFLSFFISFLILLILYI